MCGVWVCVFVFVCGVCGCVCGVCVVYVWLFVCWCVGVCVVCMCVWCVWLCVWCVCGVCDVWVLCVWSCVWCVCVCVWLCMCVVCVCGVCVWVCGVWVCVVVCVCVSSSVPFFGLAAILCSVLNPVSKQWPHKQHQYHCLFSGRDPQAKWTTARRDRVIYSATHCIVLFEGKNTLTV